MRLRTALIVVAFTPLVTGCATLRATLDGWTGGHGGLTRSQRALRDALADEDYPAALALREDDALLRLLTSGSATFYAAQYARSAALLDTAALLVDERLTASVSRNGLALVTNDMARPYQARRTERLFVPYYGMLAYARLGQWDDAAVEARRMAALLAADRADMDDGERALHASMHYLAGTVFERAGEGDDALVSYRNAHALDASYPARSASIGGDSGEVLVVVERGFVAHRVTEAIHVAIGDGDEDALHGSDETRHGYIERTVSSLAPATAPGPTSVAPGFSQAQEVASPSSAVLVPRGSASSRAAGRRARRRDDDVHWLSLAFPVLRRSPRPWAGAPRLSVDSSMALDLALRATASVDDASQADERRERSAVIARELARATTRYVATKAVEDKHGEVAGRLAEAGANLLARADVRSWHVLPQQLVLLRVRLPAGERAMAVDVGEGASARRVRLGPVPVKRGAITIAAARFWREPAFVP